MSSLVFLGLSLLAFAISFGLVWILVPMLIGSFYTAIISSGILAMLSTTWQGAFYANQAVLIWLIPLTATLGIFVFILKVLLVATTRGGD